MSFIFLGIGNDGQDMWGTLKPPTVNQVYERMTWNFVDKKYVRDVNGTMMKTGTRPGLPPPHVERGSYVGKLPSQDTVTFVNWMKDKMKFFDDGVRMVYGKPDRIVNTEPADVKHPISYPPAGFKVQTNDAGDHQWVLKRSKYE